MSKGDELKFEGGAATKAEREYGKEGGHNRDHTQDYGGGAKISRLTRCFGVLSMDSPTSSPRQGKPITCSTCTLDKTDLLINERLNTLFAAAGGLIVGRP